MIRFNSIKDAHNLFTSLIINEVNNNTYIRPSIKVIFFLRKLYILSNCHISNNYMNYYAVDLKKHLNELMFNSIEYKYSILEHPKNDELFIMLALFYNQIDLTQLAKCDALTSACVNLIYLNVQEQQEIIIWLKKLIHTN